MTIHLYYYDNKPIQKADKQKQNVQIELPQLHCKLKDAESVKAIK